MKKAIRFFYFPYFGQQNLQREDILSQEGMRSFEEPDLSKQYVKVKKQLEEKVQTLKQLNKLQEQRLSDLEWMIRKHAPELAKEIGLLDRQQ